SPGSTVPLPQPTGGGPPLELEAAVELVVLELVAAPPVLVELPPVLVEEPPVLEPPVLVVLPPVEEVVAGPGPLVLEVLEALPPVLDVLDILVPVLVGEPPPEPADRPVVAPPPQPTASPTVRAPRPARAQKKEILGKFNRK